MQPFLSDKARYTKYLEDCRDKEIKYSQELAELQRRISANRLAIADLENKLKALEQ